MSGWASDAPGTHGEVDTSEQDGLRERIGAALRAARGDRADFALCPLLLLGVPAALAVAGLEHPMRVGPLTALAGGTVSVLVAIACVLLLVRVLGVLRFGWLGTVSVWILPGVALGLTRAAMAAALGDANPEWLLRTLASTFAGVVWIPVIIATVHLRRRLAESRAALDDVRSRLLAVTALEDEARRAGTDEVGVELALHIVPELEALAAAARAADRDPAALAAVRRSAQTLLDDRVRPLSHDLAATWPDRAPAPVVAPGALIHEVLRRPVQAPWLTGLLIVAASGFDVIRAAGLETFAVGTAAVVVACAILSVVRRLTAHRSGGAATVVQWTSLLVIGFVVGVLPPLVDSLSPEFTLARQLVPVFLYLPLVALGSVATSVLRTHAESARRAIEDSRRASEQLEGRLAEIAARTAALRPLAATALHGAVQSRLAATALALSAGGAPGIDGAAIAAHLEAAAQDLLAVGHTVVDRVAALRALPTVWSGIAEIDLRIAPGLGRDLATDPDLAATVFDVARECVVNAVKHGGARHIAVRLGDHSSGIGIEAIDDGTRPQTRIGEAGLVATAVRRRGGHWVLEALPTGSRVRIELPRSLQRT